MITFQKQKKISVDYPFIIDHENNNIIGFNFCIQINLAEGEIL